MENEIIKKQLRQIIKRNTLTFNSFKCLKLEYIFKSLSEITMQWIVLSQIL